MRIHHAQSTVKTTAHVSVENVTPIVRDHLSQSGVREGLAVVTVPHTTCGLAVNEDEEGLRQDIHRMASHLLTPLAEREKFRHDCIDDNAQAHLTSLVFGPSITLPVVGGGLVLGTWQNLFLIEMDGPRSRRLNVQILGE